MLDRLTHYFSALIFLVASAVIYSNALTPWMSPPDVELIALKKSPVHRTDDSLDDLFPEGAWQRSSCKRLQTAQGVLLFQNWEQTDDSHWKLWPITVVIGRGLTNETADAPIVIDAVEGAELKFTESLDMMSGGAPPIDWGRMVGGVHIYRNGRPGGDGRHSMDLRTADVGMDTRKIWTTKTIEMSVGEAKMVGRDLTIHLAAAGGNGSAPSTVLDRMELIYLDQLMMPIGGRGLFGEGPSDGEPHGDAAGREAMISVACGGRVEYDFAIDQLLLRDSVSLVYQTDGALADRFDCQQLELTLNDPTNDAIERRSALDWLVRIVATGTPAIAKLPSIETEIAADTIDLNAVSGLLNATGSRGIRVRRGPLTASLARLIYQFDPANPAAFGILDADGAGIVTVKDPDVPVREARWRDGLHVRPKGIPTAKKMDVDVEVRIDGEVRAWLVDGGEFEADSVFGLFVPEPVNESVADGSVIGTTNESGNDDAKTTLAPEWFNIKGNVRIVSAAIIAETQEMWLNFVNEAGPSNRQGGGPTSGGGKSNAASPLRQWVSQPNADSGMVDPVARARPVVRGDSINAQLRRNSAGLSAKRLSVVGHVEVEHQIETGGQSLAARLTGESLELKDGGGEDVLQLSSSAASPARFEIGDGFFVGPQIQIRPSDNMVWINAAGEFQIPTAALPTGLAPSGNDSSTRNGASGFVWTKPPHCRWQGEMLFDGRKAVLTDGVDIEASLISDREPWELKVSGDRLEVDLQESVQMRDMASMKNAVIQKITILQANDRPVIVQAMHYGSDGVRETKHLVYANQLTMSPGDGGQLIGEGPGWYRGWSVGGTANPMAKPTTGKPQGALVSNASMVDGARDELTGIHLTFNDSMRVDLTTRNLDFLRGVRVGVQSVSGWDQAFDAAKMDAISVGQSTLDCDRLRFSVEPGRNASGGAFASSGMSASQTAWEMEATTGVIFRTRNEDGLLEGTASRAAYSASKDVFTVDGVPNRPVVFRQTRADGQPGIEGAVRTLTVHPKTMEVQGSGFERLSNAMPPSGNR
ncbi:hypothetical protein Poly51_47000 [Rubripirellula tenax]|uniref:Organic solvent tolerance-like N-terminal domain-containing protein n=1 Tax=Rubripirellula tenax TaxID=2528015 RepID=A0A5C6EML3_9BACT|nr:hypothetical protein [Rubripirellula tenax]TWU48796.1 hypothetical protein Poly51_47000 [Rubripirellula tenax]